MAIIHQMLISYKGQSSSARTNGTESITGNVEKNIAKTLAIGTNVSLLMALVRADLRSLYFYASTDTTVCTNAASGSSPQDTITLLAGQIKAWSLVNSGLAGCPFSGNVTGFFITNAAQADFEFYALLV